MTLHADGPDAQPRFPARAASAVAGALALAIMVALTWDLTLSIWTDGRFQDTDDAMRMVQVRDLLAGQRWFDLIQHRLLPPDGMPMHWTRIADLPTAAFAWAFSLVLDPLHGERLARLGYSLLFASLLLFSMARLARTLCGRAAIAPVLALIALGAFAFGQFQPGRVDHHAPQIVLLALMFEALLRALDPARTGYAAWAGACVALSFGIGVENAPFLLAACAVLPLRWVLVGASAAPSLRAFAGGLGAGLVAAFAVFAPEGPGARGACDAISTAFLGAGLAVCAGLVALTFTGPRLGTPARRLGAGALAGLAAFTLEAWLFPACMAHPFATMDRLVYEVWLQNVGESQPWLATVWKQPSAGPMMVLPQVLGLAGLCWALASTRGAARIRWAVMLSACLAGLPFALAEVRVASQLAVFTSLGAVYAALRLMRPFDGATFATLLRVIAVVPFTTVFWLLMTPDSLASRDAAPGFDYGSCRAPAQFSTLAQMPAALVLAPVDLGPHVLAFTRHSVLAAPYHRNSIGNRRAIDVFLAEPARARDLAKASGARYLAFCNGLAQAAVMAGRAPQGLAGVLQRGESVDWLAPLPGDGALKVFEVR